MSPTPQSYFHIFQVHAIMNVRISSANLRDIQERVLRAPMCNTLKRNRRRLNGHKGYSTPHYSALTNEISVLTQNDIFQRRTLSNAIMTKYSTKDYLYIQCEIIRKSIQHDTNEVFKLKNTQLQHKITKLY